MFVKGWYKRVCLIWIVAGLPVLMLGYGFAGGHFELPDMEYATWIDLVPWAAAWIALLSPIWLAPFGIGFGTSGPKADP